MEHEIDQAGQDPDGLCRGDGRDEGREAPRGIDHSIRPGVPCPETVLLAVMSDGSYLLVSYPRGEPAAFVAREDTDLLRQALEAAFGSTDEAVRGNGKGTPGNETLRTRQVQP